MCPFCYVGKRKFENALSQFNHKHDINVVWKSFQLMPDVVTDPDLSTHEFLAGEKGFSVERAKEMNSYVAEMGSQVGLKYNFDKVKVANTFNAHRFLHYAKAQGKQDEAEEALFYAHFTAGENVDDFNTLEKIGEELEFDAGKLREMLDSNAYADEVKADIREAQQIGVRGVPFFVFNRKYAVSGAQDSSVFLDALEKSYSEI